MSNDDPEVEVTIEASERVSYIQKVRMPLSEAIRLRDGLDGRRGQERVVDCLDRADPDGSSDYEVDVFDFDEPEQVDDEESPQ